MSRRIPPVATLMAFEAAGRLGSFSEAANELVQTQSAVSQQIRKLEDLVGQQLFLRKGTGVRLTSAGELLHATVSSILDQLSAGFERIEPYKNRDSVLLACPPEFARGWLNPRLDALRRRYPALEVWVITQREVREIDRIDVDLIVARRPVLLTEIECVPLIEDAALAVAAPAVARGLLALPLARLIERAPLLMLEAEPDWGGVLRQSPAPGRRPPRLDRAMTYDDSLILLDAVERGLGIGYLSRLLADHGLRTGRLDALPAVPVSPRPRLWLMRSRLTARTPFADLVFDWLRSAAAEDTPPGARARL